MFCNLPYARDSPVRGIALRTVSELQGPEEGTCVLGPGRIWVLNQVIRHRKKNVATMGEWLPIIGTLSKCIFMGIGNQDFTLGECTFTYSKPSKDAVLGYFSHLVGAPHPVLDHHNYLQSLLTSYPYIICLPFHNILHPFPCIKEKI